MDLGQLEAVPDFKIRKVLSGYAVIRAQCEAQIEIGIEAGATEVSLHKVSVKAGGAKPRPASMWGGRVVGRRGSRLRAKSEGLPRPRVNPNQP